MAVQKLPCNCRGNCRKTHKMKKVILIIYVFSVCILKSQIMWQFNSDTVKTFYYEDGDEFSATNVSKDKWKSWYGWARSITSNKEQQYYTDYKNLELKNGCLYITTNKKEVNARLIDQFGDNDSIKSGIGVFQGSNKRVFKYESGLIQSNKKFLKGYYEIKFKAPPEKGLWPAFWLYGGSPNEEIDIMELKGEREDQTHVDTHCQGCDVVKNFIGQKKSFGGWIKLNGDLDKGFNVVSALWTDEEVRYYLNGKSIAVSKVKFTQPKHMVANIAVADNNGPFHPGPNADATEFSPFIIDYIRVWSFDQDKANTISLSAADNNPVPDKTAAKHHPKMLYGKKNDHLNEGIFVSLFENEEGGFKLYCNGLGEKESYTVKFILGTEVLFEKTGNESELDIPVKSKVGLKIEVTYKGKKAEKHYLTR